MNPLSPEEIQRKMDADQRRMMRAFDGPPPTNGPATVEELNQRIALLNPGATFQFSGRPDVDPTMLQLLRGLGLRY